MSGGSDSELKGVMRPPDGFIESAVEKALAEVAAEEAEAAAWLDADEAVLSPEAVIGARRRRDSGIIEVVEEPYEPDITDDGPPTLRFVRHR